MIFDEIFTITTSTLRVWLECADSWARDSYILLPILSSIVAAVIFWIVFSYLPESKRRRKLRPIVKLTLFDIYRQLFSLFDLIMRHGERTPSFHQDRIRSGLLSKDDIWLSLQNKCLNETYRFDPNISDGLFIIGMEVASKISNINELANKTLAFHTYANADELILIEKIRESISKYPFNDKQVQRPAGFFLDGKVLYPADPSMSYWSKNLFDIYVLFVQLQKTVLSPRQFSRDGYIYKMQWLYLSGQYKKCIKTILSEGGIFESDSPSSQNYLALSRRGLGRAKAFYSTIEENYKSRPFGGSLTPVRRIFKDIIHDNKLLEVLSQFYSQSEIDSLKDAIEEENVLQQLNDEKNRSLAKYYESKTIVSRKNKDENLKK